MVYTSHLCKSFFAALHTSEQAIVSGQVGPAGAFLQLSAQIASLGKQLH
jgi:hypothetical protein